MQIVGNVALVTGTKRGLGASYAKSLLERGAAKVGRSAPPQAIIDPRLSPSGST